MAIKSILVHADSNPAHVARLRCAADLADAFEATVLGLATAAIEPAGVSDGGRHPAREAASSEASRAQIEERLIEDDLVVAEARFREVFSGRPHEWRQRRSTPTEAMAEMARAADLIVAGGGDPSAPLDPGDAVDTGRLIVTAGRPVLLCPEGADRYSPRSVLVAWKDTRESRRALADALPFLRRAQEVVLLDICAEEEERLAMARGLDLVLALRRHGVIAEPRAVVRRGSTSDTLLEQADAMGAALIVAGGYGHSRFGEWIFGGVTDTLLQQRRRFVLFSH
jgi:nucleotide-binding universal stress UspA family protein